MPTTPGYHFPAGLHIPVRNDLLAYNFHRLRIQFEDGAQWEVDAMVEREGEFDVVYTEHLGYHVFHLGAIESVDKMA